MLNKYRKKPVVITAHQFDGSSSGVCELQHWIETGTFTKYQIRTRDLGRTFKISTLEGDMLVSPGDYVIQGVQGEFYPCKPEIFEATYEVANEPA